MNDALLHAAAALAEAAGWDVPQADAEGIFRFSLEGELEFSLFSPDGRTGILLGSLGQAPDCSTPQGAAELDRLAALSAGVLKDRLSVLSLSESDLLELHRSFPLHPADGIKAHAKDFLNDLAWWKRQVQNHSSRPAADSSPFSFSFESWFPK